MAKHRKFLLFLATALILGVSGCSLSWIRDPYPHYPHLRLADAEGNLHWFEVDARVVEAIYLAPASPGRKILFERLERLGMNPDSARTVDLYDYLTKTTVDTTVFVPDPVAARVLGGEMGLQVRAALMSATGTPFATDTLWGRDFPRDPVEFQVSSTGGEITIRGFFIRESIRVAKRAGFWSGHNPEGLDECIKISTCELFCDTEEN